jgi:hypothetical protein
MGEDMWNNLRWRWQVFTSRPSGSQVWNYKKYGKYNFRLGIVTFAMPSMENKFISADPLNLSCGVGNFEKVRSAIWQHEIPYLE